MATRTSSPPGSRSKSMTSSKGGRAPSSRTRSAGSTTKRSTSSTARQPAPRAVRNGRGPVAGLFFALFRGVAALWLAVAHGIGTLARSIGHGARDLDPEHRRDGAGLFVLGLALIVAGAVWFGIEGGGLGFVRTIVTGSVGKV